MPNRIDKKMLKWLSPGRRGLKLLIIIPVLIALVFNIGCDKNKNSNDPEYRIAKIGDEFVTLALYTAAFESYAEYLSQMGYDPFSSASELEGFQDMVLDALVNDIVALHHAKKDGFSLSDSAKAEVEAQAKEELEQIKADYMLLAEEAHKNDSALTVQQHYDALIAELAEMYTGRKMSFDEYSEEYTTELMNARLIEDYKASICAEFVVSEAAIADWYGEQYEVDEKLYSDEPEQYKADMEYYELYSNERSDAYPPTYVPDGYFRIFDIVVRPEGELNEEYKTKIEELTRIGEECATLLFNDALNDNDANAERIAELIEQYRTLEGETKTMYESYTASARAKIDEAYSELEAGRSFQEVMLKYSENALVVGNGENAGCIAFQTKGQLISPVHTSRSDWSSTVKEIFGMTEEGAYSAVFTDMDGSFHIIYRSSAEQSGRVPLENIRQQIESIVKAESAEKDWNELMEAWCDDHALSIDMEAVRRVGADKLKKNNN